MAEAQSDLRLCKCAKVCGIHGVWIPKSTYHRHNSGATKAKKKVSSGPKSTRQSSGGSRQHSEAGVDITIVNSDVDMSMDPPQNACDASALNHNAANPTSNSSAGIVEPNAFSEDRFDMPQSSTFDAQEHNMEDDMDQDTLRAPSPSDDMLAEPHLLESTLEDFQIANAFIRALRDASLDDEEEKLDSDTLHRLRNPPQEPPTLDTDKRLSIDIFLAVSNASEQTYNSVRDALLRRYPENPILSHHCVKKLISDLTGVVYVTRDMCVNSCMAFTGPFASLDRCKYQDCSEPRYDPKHPEAQIPQQQFNTILLGPQLQALRRSIEGATELCYRERITKAIFDNLDENDDIKTLPYTDFFDGADYIEAVRTGKIKRGDNILMLSVDGAQLYRNKTSDCWIAAWIIIGRSRS
ncbi:hypothetical protein C8R45DRAFT_485809 [Mycena sanguinolenta]|nr:hypothetical protein C8R45DRAFT_485809 [Mycena sanguinolenta]